MESNFNNRDFEQYVKKNADQYRMIPSEKVWKGINNVLHTRRKWYSIGLGLILLSTAISVTWVMISYPVSKMKAPSPTSSLANNEPQSSVNQSGTNSPLEKSISNLLSFNKINKNNTNSFNNEAVQDLLSNVLLQTDHNTSDLIVVTTQGNSLKINADKSETNSTIENTNESKIAAPEVTLFLPAEEASAESNSTTVAKEVQQYNLPTIESVTNAYQAKKVSKKLIWQIYFMPTVSYRKLSENKSYQESVSLSAANYPFATSSDINRAVTHRSDMGLELGVSAKYPLSKNLKLTGGLQFNINRYDIKAAYQYSSEPATISLNGGNGNDLVTTWTNYRNYNGSRSDWLKNFYFSVSAPVGAELKVLGGNKTYFGIAGTVQPTYVIGDKAYLLSTDYKNYAEVPGLIRHVNVNTSFETFISYSSRSLRWQIGPQIRYQVLSSFKDKYPVRENLFDYGVKIGITLNP